MSAITTHVLDTALGGPAADVPVRLERVADSGNTEVGRARTDHDGRATDLGPDQIEPGTYRLIFDTGAYARAQRSSESSGPAFFPEVTITFTVEDQSGHYHVPLLLSPFGYTTYRGS